MVGRAGGTQHFSLSTLATPLVYGWDHRNGLQGLWISIHFNSISLYLNSNCNCVLNDAQPCSDAIHFRLELRGCFPLIYVNCQMFTDYCKFKANCRQSFGQLTAKGAAGLLQGCRLEYRITDQCKQNLIIKIKLNTLKVPYCQNRNVLAFFMITEV